MGLPARRNNVHLSTPSSYKTPALSITQGASICPVSDGVGLKVCVEVLQVAYQFLLQTVGKGLLTSLRCRSL